VNNKSEEFEWIPQSCPLCPEAKQHRIGSRGGASHRDGIGAEAQIFECSSCGLLFPNPMPFPKTGEFGNYDLEPGDYFQHHDLQSKLDNSRQMVAWAEELLGRKGRILDIGAGMGTLLKAAKEAGWEVTGVEPSTSFADMADEFSGVKVHRERLQECGFAEGEFDVVILAAVLEHLYHPVEVLSEISRITADNGLLFFDVPNEKGLYFTIGNLYQRMKGRDWTVNLAPTFEPFHVFGYSKKPIRKLLSAFDFDIVFFRTYAGVSLVPSSGSMRAKLESMAAKSVTKLAGALGRGTYIEAWAKRKPRR
jgi:SAM-dependent methyltransferase